MGRPSLLGVVAAMSGGTDKIYSPIRQSHAPYLADSPLPRQGAAHKGNLDKIYKINRIAGLGAVRCLIASNDPVCRSGWTKQKSAIKKGLSQRHEDAKENQQRVGQDDRMDKIYRMVTGGARCSGLQISHPLLLQASLRAAGCRIASSAARMTLSAGVVGTADKICTS